jgi:hypothetical protein
MAEHEDAHHQGEPCRLVELSTAMYAVVEQRAGNENVQAVIMLNDPDDPGHNSISVFGYPRDDRPVTRVIEDLTYHLHEFGRTFGVHVDVYVDGMRLTEGRQSPNAS